MLKCKKHKTYKAVREPTADCEECRNMYRERQQEEIEAFLYKVDTEGLEYAVENYPLEKPAPKYLIEQTKKLQKTIDQYRGILDNYREIYGIEYF